MQTDFNQFKHFFITLLIGSAITLSLYHFEQEKTAKLESERFIKSSNDRMNSFEDKLQESLSVLSSLNAFYASSKFVDRFEFKSFTQPILKNHKEIQALEWIPMINQAGVETLEQLAWDDGLTEFKIIEYDNNHQAIPVTARAKYYPVFYVEPLQGNEKAFGFDLGSNQVRLDALALAARLNEIVITAPITLVQETTKQQAVLGLQPFFKQSKTTDTHSESLKLQGYLLIVLRLNDFYEYAISSVFHDQGISITVHDQLTGTWLAGTKSSAEKTPNMHSVNRTIKVGTRHWTLVASAKKGYLNNPDRIGAEFILILGIFASLALAAYLHTLIQRNAYVDEQVRIRTDQLRQSQSRYQSVIETAADAIITVDPSGHITSFNSAATVLFGYEHDEALQANITALIPNPHPEKQEDYINLLLRTDENNLTGMGREIRAQRKDNSTFPAWLSIGKSDGIDPVCFTAIIRDITELKRIEKMKTEFISTVSHELRTPLTSIKGSLGLLVGGAVGNLPEQAQDMLHIASNNTERLLLLINDILDIQKIESGQTSFKFQNIPIMPLIVQSLEDNEAYGNQFGVSFTLTAKVDNVRIYADKDRLMQVMANLLSNAAKFSPENDTVEIAVVQFNGYVRVSITDYGSGVPEDFQPILFDKFTQSDSSDSRQKGGTGLGLCISKAIMEKHGGNINLITREGLGTTFYIEMPQLMGEMPTESDPLKVESRKPSVLIVEANQDIAAMIRRMLAENGIDSTISKNVVEAREELQKNPSQYRAITLDIDLPNIDGVSLLAELHKESITRDIPVIVLSASTDDAKRKLQMGAVGLVDWLQKPIDPENLIQAIKQAGHLKPHVLHVEDDPDIHSIVKTILSDHCDLTWSSTLAASKEAMLKQKFDLVLLDIGLPDGSGLDLLEVIEQQDNPARVVIFSAYDVSEDVSKKVSRVLMKSKTDELKLIQIIKELIDS